MNRTSPPIFSGKLVLAPILIILIFLSGCQQGPGGSVMEDSFGLGDDPKVSLPVVHPPKIKWLGDFEYLKIHDFKGVSTCAEPMKRKIEELAGALGDQGFKLGPIYPKKKTVELSGEIIECQNENTYGQLDAEFSFKTYGVKRETKTLSKNVTLGPGSTKDRVIRKLVKYVGRNFAENYLPRKVESLRNLCGAKNDSEVTAMQKGSWDAAISILRGKLNQDRENSCIENNLGVAWEGRKNLGEANTFFQLAMAHGDDHFAPGNYAELRRYCPAHVCDTPPPCSTYPYCDSVCPIKEKDSRPKPSWVNTMPSVPGYKIVVRGSASGGKTLAEMEKAATASARAELSAVIQVKVLGKFEQTISEMNRSSGGSGISGESSTSSETSTYVEMITREKTESILKGVRPLEYWKDKGECTVYALMGISQASLEKSLAAYQKQWEQSLLSKKLMLFDVSETHSDMAELLQGKFREVLNDLRIGLLKSDPELKFCLREPKQEKCQGTMFGGLNVEVLSETKWSEGWAREFLIKGEIVFGDRLVFQMNETCLAQGSVGDSNRVIDENGIKECFDTDIAPLLLRDIQR